MKPAWKRVCALGVSLWGRLFHRLTPVRLYRAFFLETDEHLPTTLRAKTVYIVGVRGNEWLAVMLCPCGCRERLFLNLLKDEFPYWSWHADITNAVTLGPSVWRKVGCKSHFLLRKGQIQWCEPSL